MSETSTKTFDTVQMVRAIRDDISSKIIQMSAEQENEWLRSTELSDPRLRQLMDLAAQQRAAADAASRRG
jgi:hypothetical protein